MFWYKKDEKRWAVLYFDPVSHKRMRLNDYDRPPVNPPGKPYAEYDFDEYGFDENVVVVAVENDTETKWMKDLRVACEHSWKFRCVHALIKDGVVLRETPGPWVLRPNDQMEEGYALVSDNSRVFLELAGASDSTLSACDNYACERIIRMVLDRTDSKYVIAWSF